MKVGQLKKFGESKGLGISLEGTVDVEDGQEVRPHHYIRSILPEGPVGQNGKLRSGDELLEVKKGYSDDIYQLLTSDQKENILPVAASALSCSCWELPKINKNH
ncbi:unnamed protein product [Nezara viridula]|uniref:PDZ domain-containing protein n=1 Tax=Nezara viridula TaxID=85310 RepID=A0A9P0ECR7_NEZVI|nr:unnamed protein product [Nezara viridula]